MVKLVGNKVTDQVQLDQAGKKLFGSDWDGVYPRDQIIGLNKYGIVNNEDSLGSGEHWIALYMPKGKKVYVYDSFGRRSKDILGPVFPGKIVINADGDAEQHSLETNCGARCLGFLQLVKSEGIRKALKL